MTRDFLFTLTDTTKTYNLWTDLVTQSLGFDPTMANTPYISSLCYELEVQNQTPGATIKRNGFNLTGGSWDVTRGSLNSIDLKSTTLKTDTNPTVVYVKATSL